MSTWQDRFSLQGRTALVTGASKGIGFEICTVLADAGADIVGTVDILVNNAGIAKTAYVLDFDLQDWDESMTVNLRAPFLLSQLLAPGMIEQRWGKIINISSQAAMLAFDEHTAYSASKAALNAMTRGLMKEWAQYNIQVNSVCPTIVLTDMGKEVWSGETKSAPMINRTPLGRFGEPIEVADMVLYLASSASALVNGESLMIDGGFTAA